MNSRNVKKPKTKQFIRLHNRIVQADTLLSKAQVQKFDDAITDDIQPVNKQITNAIRL